MFQHPLPYAHLRSSLRPLSCPCLRQKLPHAVHVYEKNALEGIVLGIGTVSQASKARIEEQNIGLQGVLLEFSELSWEALYLSKNLGVSKVDVIVEVVLL